MEGGSGPLLIRLCNASVQHSTTSRQLGMGRGTATTTCIP